MMRSTAGKQGDADDAGRFTIKRLALSDRLQTETVKDVVLGVERRFSANESGDRSFDEIFKLIFTKLYDEVMSGDDADMMAQQMMEKCTPLENIDDSGFRIMQFHIIADEPPADTYRRVSALFGEAKSRWPGVFAQESGLDMRPETLTACVGELQDVKLFNSNLEVVDDLFEHLVNRSLKEEMGQYFTPRYVIDMCVKMLNPKPEETMIDTAAGSCGFPLHTIFHVWKQLNPSAYNLFTTSSRSQRELDYVRNNVFGVDFSEQSLSVGRMLGIIAGDGDANMINLNTLDYPHWGESYNQPEEWRRKYGEGFRRLAAMSAQPDAPSDDVKYHRFNFDVLMANPPFSGDLDDRRLLGLYSLGRNDKGRLQKRISRDILFVERNLDFLKPGGRMAIILPQGRFNNASDKRVRDYIADRCRILAVVGLHGNVFKPYTGTKTSVLFVQKWTDEHCGFPNICPKPEPDENGVSDYPIFFATMREPSKDNSGERTLTVEHYITWTSYSYVTERMFTRKSDGSPVTEEEYDTAEDRAGGYKASTVTKTIRTAHTTESGDRKFIRDLFVEAYGDPDTHRTYIRRNCIFNLKRGRAESDADSDRLKDHLTMDEYLALPAKDAGRYRCVDIIGENTNTPITADEYGALPPSVRKWYLPAEEIRETVEPVRDTHGHVFVRHDLFNHDPNLPNPNPHNMYSKDGIAEAFAEFAKREKLSFFR